ncbi:MAG TPA: F0F1 ATP synthase subunit A [Micromonosporaceae bacterium]|jgi:F-type H+-transporting ATPase subunit a
MSTTTVAVGEIDIGHHITVVIFGLTFNVDTILSTVVAGAIVIGLGLLVSRKISARTPNRVQLVFETVTTAVRNQVESTMGIQTAPFVVPLAIALFMFILIANWLAIIPTGHNPEYLPPPASDVNLAYALALLVIVWMHVTGVRKKGFRAYYHHLAQPSWLLFPINLVEEIARPITLSLRLFGNIFSGVIMLSLIALFPAYILWAPNVIWKLFDLFIGLIQAFIFALLTILYFGSVAPSEDEAH